MTLHEFQMDGTSCEMDDVGVCAEYTGAEEAVLWEGGRWPWFGDGNVECGMRYWDACASVRVMRKACGGENVRVARDSCVLKVLGSRSNMDSSTSA